MMKNGEMKSLSNRMEKKNIAIVGKIPEREIYLYHSMKVSRMNEIIAFRVLSIDMKILHELNFHWIERCSVNSHKLDLFMKCLVINAVHKSSIINFQYNSIRKDTDQIRGGKESPDPAEKLRKIEALYFDQNIFVHPSDIS